MAGSIPELQRFAHAMIKNLQMIAVAGNFRVAANALDGDAKSEVRRPIAASALLYRINAIDKHRWNVGKPILHPNMPTRPRQRLHIVFAWKGRRLFLSRQRGKMM